MGNCQGSHKKSPVKRPPIEMPERATGHPFLKFKVKPYETPITEEDASKEGNDPTDQASVSQELSAEEEFSPSCSSSQRWSFSTSDELYGINVSQWHMFGTSNLRAFPYIMLKNATRGFHDENLIGEGEYGSVYEGFIKETTGSSPTKTILVAIKMMNELSDAYLNHDEWMEELCHLGHLQHPNIVKLIGYCIDHHCYLLVYEHVPNRNLDYHLSSRAASDRPLFWAIRLKIALGVATGLAYLHTQHPRFVFKECKAANVLLDRDYNVKLSDYGMEREHQIRDNHSAYAAPEDPKTAQFTTVSDVYAFGIILLEILSGRRALDSSRPGKEHVLRTWATSYLSGDKDYRKLMIMDKRLKDEYPKKLACEVAKLAFSCLQAAESRPNMNYVVVKLKELWEMQETGRICTHLLDSSDPDVGNRYIESTTSCSSNHFHNSSTDEEIDTTSSVVSLSVTENPATEMFKMVEM